MGEATVPAQHPATGQASRVPAPDVDARRASHREGPPPEGPRPALGLIWRVRDRATFEELRRGHRARRATLTVSFVGNPAQPVPRVAYAVGRANGGAVVRNRTRRRLRAAMRSLAAAGRLAPGAYLVGAAPGSEALGWAELEQLLGAAVNSASSASSADAAKSVNSSGSTASAGSATTGPSAASLSPSRRSPGGRSRPR
jgi:ribonuclease P protein component